MALHLPLAGSPERTMVVSPLKPEVKSVPTTEVKEIKTAATAEVKEIKTAAMTSVEDSELTPATVTRGLSKRDAEIGAAAKRGQSFVFFNKLPKDILAYKVLSYLDFTKDPKTASALARTRKSEGALFRCHLPCIKQDRLSEFLKAIIDREFKKVKEILTKATPSLRSHLLLTHAEVKDEVSKRTVFGTALQMALGSLDISLAEMIMEFLEQLPEGKKIKQDQILEQFPDHWELEWCPIESLTRGALNEVIRIIGTAKLDNNCKTAETKLEAQLLENALARLEDALQYKGIMISPCGAITINKLGTYFLAYLLENTVRLVANVYAHYNARQRDFLWKRVIGRIQRDISAYCRKALCVGIDRGRPCMDLNDETTLPPVNVLPHPLDSTPSDRLGYDYAIGWAVGNAGRKSSGTPIDFNEDALHSFFAHTRVNLRRIIHDARYPIKPVPVDRECRSKCVIA